MITPRETLRLVSRYITDNDAMSLVEQYVCEMEATEMKDLNIEEIKLARCNAATHSVYELCQYYMINGWIRNSVRLVDLCITVERAMDGDESARSEIRRIRASGWNWGMIASLFTYYDWYDRQVSIEIPEFYIRPLRYALTHPLGGIRGFELFDSDKVISFNSAKEIDWLSGGAAFSGEIYTKRIRTSGSIISI